jgi:hypothetical protein
MTLSFRRLAAAAAIALAAPVAVQASDAKTVRVQFNPGATGTIVSGQITGDEYVLYKLGAREGQFLSVYLNTDNESADYNIYIPGRGPGDEALFTSAEGGREYRGQLYVTGDHTVSVFLNRNAARQGQTASFDITFEIE